MDERKGHRSCPTAEPSTQPTPSMDGSDQPKPTRICICMGSSCFARGNGQNTRVIKEYLARSGAKDSVELVGLLCEGKCSAGPNLHIDNNPYRGVSPAALITILEHHLPGGRGEKTS